MPKTMLVSVMLLELMQPAHADDALRMWAIGKTLADRGTISGYVVREKDLTIDAGIDWSMRHDQAVAVAIAICRDARQSLETIAPWTIRIFVPLKKEPEFTTKCKPL